MPSTRPSFTAPGRLQGILVWWLVALILILGLLAVSPAAHALIHRHEVASQGPADHQHAHQTHDDTGCAVTLFQHGVATSPGLPSIGTPFAIWIATLPPAPADPFSAAPRHLLKPARGPPCQG